MSGRTTIGIHCEASRETQGILLVRCRHYVLVIGADWLRAQNERRGVVANGRRSFNMNVLILQFCFVYFFARHLP